MAVGGSWSTGPKVAPGTCSTVQRRTLPSSKYVTRQSRRVRRGRGWRAAVVHAGGDCRERPAPRSAGPASPRTGLKSVGLDVSLGVDRARSHPAEQACWTPMRVRRSRQPSGSAGTGVWRSGYAVKGHQREHRCPSPQPVASQRRGDDGAGGLHRTAIPKSTTGSRSPRSTADLHLDRPASDVVSEPSVVIRHPGGDERRERGSPPRARRPQAARAAPRSEPALCRG